MTYVNFQTYIIITTYPILKALDKNHIFMPIWIFNHLWIKKKKKKIVPIKFKKCLTASISGWQWKQAQWSKVKASKVTKQSVQYIIYKELKKKKTLDAKMQIQHRLKRIERERERERERRRRRRRRRRRCNLKSDSLTVSGWSWRL